MDSSCQLAGLAVATTLSDPDAGLTDATGLVRLSDSTYLYSPAIVPDYQGALPASWPPYRAQGLALLYVAEVVSTELEAGRVLPGFVATEMNQPVAKL